MKLLLHEQAKNKLKGKKFLCLHKKRLFTYIKTNAIAKTILCPSIVEKIGIEQMVTKKELKGFSHNLSKKNSDI